MTTWRDIAWQRGFRELGGHQWAAPNGQTVAEGFVAAMCQPERVAVEEMAMAPCQRPVNELRRHNADAAAFGQVKRSAHPHCGGRRNLVIVKHLGRSGRSEAA